MSVHNLRYFTGLDQRHLPTSMKEVMALIDLIGIGLDIPRLYSLLKWNNMTTRLLGGNVYLNNLLTSVPNEWMFVQLGTEILQAKLIEIEAP